MKRAIEVGPTGQQVAQNILRLRKRRNLSTRELSRRLEASGRSIPASGLTKMEHGERRVDVDDLAALAVIFGVSPSALLLPLEDSPNEMFSVTGAGEVRADAAWDWMDGRGPLVFVVDSAQAISDESIQYALWSRPPCRRMKELGGG